MPSAPAPAWSATSPTSRRAGGWLHLACRLDLATREVVGYAMADHHRAELVVDALDMAHGRGRPEPGCVIHSDRGSEYTSGQSQQQVRELGLRQSCGRTGSCFGDAAAERFRALLKEEIGTRTRPDRATARAEVFTFIETFYNRRRLPKRKILATSRRPRPGSGINTPSRHDERVSKITG